MHIRNIKTCKIDKQMKENRRTKWKKINQLVGGTPLLLEGSTAALVKQTHYCWALPRALFLSEMCVAATNLLFFLLRLIWGVLVASWGAGWSCFGLLFSGSSDACITAVSPEDYTPLRLLNTLGVWLGDLMGGF